ncbi:MAG TPA: hypothetical protein VLA19_14960, partial [Herpetosiphonaceae bacterium]|nr:hypothetical protein [Herpetosiphonaceae bacterium]
RSTSCAAPPSTGTGDAALDTVRTLHLDIRRLPRHPLSSSLLTWHVPANRWRTLVWDRQADCYHDLDGAGAARFRLNGWRRRNDRDRP